MEIIENKEIKYLSYGDVLTRQTYELKEGIIIGVNDLISPMRSSNNIGLKNKEPHIIVKRGKECVFIPVADITTLKYK